MMSSSLPLLRSNHIEVTADFLPDRLNRYTAFYAAMAGPTDTARSRHVCEISGNLFDDYCQAVDEESEHFLWSLARSLEADCTWLDCYRIVRTGPSVETVAHWLASKRCRLTLISVSFFSEESVRCNVHATLVEHYAKRNQLVSLKDDASDVLLGADGLVMRLFFIWPCFSPVAVARRKSSSAMVAFVCLIAILEAAWLVWFSDGLSQLMVIAIGIVLYYGCRDNVTPKGYLIPEFEGANVRSFCDYIQRNLDGDDHQRWCSVTW